MSILLDRGAPDAACPDDVQCCLHRRSNALARLPPYKQLRPIGSTKLTVLLLSTFLRPGTEALVLRPSCTWAALQLSRLQPLAALRSLDLPCAPCRQLSVPSLVDLTLAAGCMTKLQLLPWQRRGHTASPQRLDMGAWHSMWL